MKKKVLFICVHNSARSQMAEAFLNRFCWDEFEAHSAGLEPGKLNAVVVEAMFEVGVDISKNSTQAAFDVWKSGQMFSYVITVCNEADAEGCGVSGRGETTTLAVRRPIALRRRPLDEAGANAQGARRDPRQDYCLVRRDSRRSQLKPRVSSS